MAPTDVRGYEDGKNGYRCYGGYGDGINGSWIICLAYLLLVLDGSLVYSEISAICKEIEIDMILSWFYY